MLREAPDEGLPLVLTVFVLDVMADIKSTKSHNPLDTKDIIVPMKIFLCIEPVLLVLLLVESKFKVLFDSALLVVAFPQKEQNTELSDIFLPH